MAVALRDLSNGKKAKEDQIVGVLGLVADFDDIDAANYAARLPVEPSLVLETSPGRFQAFVFFDHPISVSQAKPLAQRLKAATRCDHGTVDCSHVWRIPGTQNWPNKKKADAGRSLDPWTVRVAVPFEGLVISPAHLDAAMPAAQVVELPRISLTQHRPAADDIEARMARSYPPGDRSGTRLRRDLHTGGDGIFRRRDRVQGRGTSRRIWKPLHWQREAFGRRHRTGAQQGHRAI